MADETKSSDIVRLLAKEQGIERALELFPKTVNAAAERGLRPLSERKGGTSPLTPPAIHLDLSRSGK